VLLLLFYSFRLQENSSEIPAGSMPRIIEVIVTRALCDKCKPGDKVVIGGCLAAVPDVPSLMKPGELPKSVAIDRNRLARRTDMGGLDQGVSGLRKLGK
jgi:DNA replication licensing factor MCM6